MPVPPPDRAALARLSEHYHFGLSAAELEEYQPVVAAALRSADAVERLYARIAPTAPERAWSRPTPEENPLGAWYVTTSVKGAADGPLAGRTAALKDNICLAGVPMTNGSRTVEGLVPSRDATVVTRLLGAGATITGKAVCEDLCLAGCSYTSSTGRVLNPWDHGRNTGGSSSGSAALVSSGAVDVALGGDQAGSVRIPAAFTGIVGHKPTHGLVPYTGTFPIEQTIDHLGPMTRTVADAALLLDVLAGVDGLDPRQPTVIEPAGYLDALATPTTGLRIGVLREGFGTHLTDPRVDDVVREAIATLQGGGLTAEEVSIPWHRDAVEVWHIIGGEGAAFQMLDGNGYGMNSQGLYDPELIEYFAAHRREHGAELPGTVKVVGLAGRHSFEAGGGKSYAMARNLAFDIRKAYDDALASFDVLVLPTLPFTALEFPESDVSLRTMLHQATSVIINTAPFDISGHPACTVPAGLVDGLPVGLMIVGKRFADETVLRVAHTFEQLVGGFPAPPA